MDSGVTPSHFQLRTLIWPKPTSKSTPLAIRSRTACTASSLDFGRMLRCGLALTPIASGLNADSCRTTALSVLMCTSGAHCRASVGKSMSVSDHAVARALAVRLTCLALGEFFLVLG
ncbi:hypothetical protein D3C87_1185390 [compost metagenome]